MDDLFREATAAVEHGLASMARGDPAPFQACWAQGDETTLFGAWGTVERGSEAINATLTWVGHRFRGGELTPSYEIVHVAGDLAYTVGHERGMVHVDAGQPFEMLIRVTHIYRKLGGQGWKLVHRHADYPPKLAHPPRL